MSGSDTPEVAAEVGELPVPWATFAASVKGTPHEVWLTYLRMKHGVERHTLAGWHELIEQVAGLPAHPAHSNA